jgi:hypothetical protein
MSKILQIDPSYDLILTYSWSSNNHSICGHTFEVFDYYYILKDHFKVGILFAEDITLEQVEKSIRSKYSFTEDEINDLLINTFFSNRPRIVKCKNILITDGGMVNMKNVTLLCDSVFYFACGNKEIALNDKDNTYILQDDRVYDKVALNGINYKKRILFNKLKRIGESKDAALVYATKNCRNVENFDELKSYHENILVITNEENRRENFDNFTFVTPPLSDIFEQFTTYIYTPVQRKWDCSPRFIAECHYYNKQVVYHNIDYWGIDHGLYWRYYDIQNDFDSLALKPDDEIVHILKRFITN